MKRLLFCLFLLLSFSIVSATNYNYTVDCITDSSGNIVESTDTISPNATYKITQKTFKNIDENSNTTFCMGKFVKKEAAIVPISNSTSYIGYYADIDGDGAVDGVIFADLAFSKSGKWQDYSWSYSAQSNLKQYYISQESYTDKFGTAAVLSPVSGTTGNERFYIIALSCVGNTAYDWYNAAYNNATNILASVSSSANDFGSGKSNTTTVMAAWKNKTYTQDACSSHKDIWGQIQTQVANGWFVPSKSEWAAFGSAFSITKSNYGSLGFGYFYWSSSLNNAEYANSMGFHDGTIVVLRLDQFAQVQLVTTY